jgi:hypothetical protein
MTQGPIHTKTLNVRTNGLNISWRVTGITEEIPEDDVALMDRNK